ncbi:hypothetical protein LTR10_022651 [Elasticomyces elasticus]|uniref:Uncharacterized protein n=1 Tax=Exophiala sideris TaxID=1016849 RepID=A0ABR0IXH1_9EURO|nr:hypothetical protein LTR10_022651 [Elasticomyces elasticus]KAK5021909.1 hypothetical protein LTS07_010491 [Exophiala sideris]KAK5025972.1 hypothetical protein LTR13_010129 [Exophiala sideris]KAK5050659.1 hypothetical protein LTR69_010515 [Exophiala sideris]KAK5177144.1 hypothetical protein LTR44_010272 [Eurotiomycetes sp. CCFEE 6388]
MPYLCLYRQQQPMWKIINFCLFACFNLAQLQKIFQNPCLPYDYLTNAVPLELVCYLALPYLATTALKLAVQYFQFLRQNILLHTYARVILSDSNIDGLGRNIFDHYIFPFVLDIIDALSDPYRPPSPTVPAASVPRMVLDDLSQKEVHGTMRNMVTLQGDSSGTQQQSTEPTERETADAQGYEEGGTERNDRQDSWDSGYGGSEQSGNEAGEDNGREPDGNDDSGHGEDQEAEGDEDKGEDDDKSEDDDNHKEEDEEEEDGKYEGEGKDKEEEGDNAEDSHDAAVAADAAAKAAEEVEEADTTPATDHNLEHDAGDEEEEEEPEQPEQFRFVPYDALGRRNAWDFTNIPTIRDRNTAFLLRRAQRACRRGRE